MPVNEDSVSNQWIGKELAYVGYGVTGDNRSDSGVKRFAWMEVDSISSVSGGASCV